MSNSTKKTPICGMSLKESEKQDKRRMNRSQRIAHKQQIKQALRVGTNLGTSELVYKDEVMPVWAMDKDGKQYFDPEKHPDLMRK